MPYCRYEIYEIVQMKELVAKEIAKKVRDNEIIGVGTGSTVDVALAHIGERVSSEKLNVLFVPTSYQSAWRCEEMGLKVLYPGFMQELSWGFDGADEVNEKLWLIKGKGGAMLQEKILAVRCKDYIIIVDETKFVAEIGSKCAVPVEIIPESLSFVKSSLSKLGTQEITLRSGVAKHGPVITEGGNIILDAKFSEITENLEKEIKSIVGVVESGLFINYATEILVGSKSGVKILKR